MPETLFRYRPINKFTFDEILNRYLFFNLPKNFNDPFEFYFDHSSLSSAAELLATQAIEEKKIKIQEKKVYLELKLRFEAELNKSMKIKRDELFTKGVCCFSSTNRNALMWSHYADGHRGICIEYKMDLFHGKIHEVIYSEKPTRLNFKDGKVDIERLVKEFISTKQLEWSYEKEFRVIHGDGSKRVHLGRDRIASISFGLMTPKEDADAICRAVITNNSNVKFFKMFADSGSWELNPFESEFIPE